MHILLYFIERKVEEKYLSLKMKNSVEKYCLKENVFTYLQLHFCYQYHFNCLFKVTRHGSRAPLYFYSNDPYKDPEYWPEGAGGLTAVSTL